jgi:hypothetical protein
MHLLKGLKSVQFLVRFPKKLTIFVVELTKTQQIYKKEIEYGKIGHQFV